ncbi:MAG: hypothetical protein V2J51_01590 [Erythrobacter sp.]|jgi:hypothetical protein|nr:hypothetical protein [Erythrobacter sp.]
MVSRLAALFWAFTLAVTCPAAASDWLRAESEHYIVHAELDEAELRAVVQRMEDFHALLQQILPTETKLGRKAVFFLEADPRKISSTSPLKVASLGDPEPEEVSAYAYFNPLRDPRTRFTSVFHPQARFMVRNSYFRTAAPWIDSGLASFFSTASFEKAGPDDPGSFTIGAPDLRGPWQIRATPRDLKQVLTRTNWEFERQEEFRVSYLMASAAASVLMTDAAFSQGIERYLKAFNAGVPMDEAIAELGDLDALAAAITTRAETGKVRLERHALEAGWRGEITVEPMREEEVELIFYRFSRLNGEKLERNARKLERLTRRYPQSADVWLEYAATEFARVRKGRSGGEVFRGFGFSNGVILVVASPYSDRAAWEAVNRALALDPANVAAKVLRAEILLGRLVLSIDKDESETYEDLRQQLRPIAADPEGQPLAAALLFQSYIEQGEVPPPDALDLLARAFRANPGVQEFRYAYAVALSREGDREGARVLLLSMLNNPEYAEAARRALEAS